MFPPASSPFSALLEDKKQPAGPIYFLDDDRVVVRTECDDSVRFHIIDGEQVELLDGVLGVGRSPDRRLFAVATDGGIEIRGGWSGPTIDRFKWTSDWEGLLDHPDVVRPEVPVPISHLVPFPSGERVLVVSARGILVVSRDRTRLLDMEVDEEFLEDWKQDCPGEKYVHDLDMAHGAISPDGRYLAIGDQASYSHDIYDEGLEQIAFIGPLSEYPHFAAFSKSGHQVALNACHFWNGATIGVPTSGIRGLKTDQLVIDPRCKLLDDRLRVHSAVAREQGYIFGASGGTIKAVSYDGEDQGWYEIGATVLGLDITEDETRLVAATVDGIVHWLELDTGVRDRFKSGTATHRELKRLMLWKDEARPLLW